MNRFRRAEPEPPPWWADLIWLAAGILTLTAIATGLLPATG